MYMQQRVLVWMLVVVLGGSCRALPFDAAAPAAHSAHQVHWEYSGEKGPAHWGELAKEFALCGSGTAQTPIDIEPTTREALTNPELRYQQGLVTVVNNGHTVQINAAPGNGMTIDGVHYALVQMHFHAPSEHTVAGEPAPLELHFVHKSADGTLAVLGALVHEGAQENPAWSPVVAALADHGTSAGAGASRPDHLPLHGESHDATLLRGGALVGGANSAGVERRANRRIYGTLHGQCAATPRAQRAPSGG
jgi:carbonic anhydrase